jgi:hypothetical protein
MAARWGKLNWQWQMQGSFSFDFVRGQDGREKGWS